MLSFFCVVYCFADELIIEPDQGRTPLLAEIQKADNIQVVMYGFTDPIFISSLINAHRSGKKISILLEPHPYKNENENNFAISELKSAQMNLSLPNSQFQLLHQKTFILDKRKAIIMTFNLTRSTFLRERNFALMTDNPNLVNEIENIFNSDNRQKTFPVHESNLIWSPDNSRKKILELIGRAHDDINIYAQSISDYQTIGALAKAARRGIKIKILTSNFSNTYKKMAYLKKSGVHIRFNKKLIIHAKVMIIDHKKAVIGSINLTRASFDKNRELSVITQDPKVIQLLDETFNKDWGRKHSYVKTKQAVPEDCFFCNAKKIHYVMVSIKKFLLTLSLSSINGGKGTS